MQLKDFARRLPGAVWELFEPFLPARIGCGTGLPTQERSRLFATAQADGVSGHRPARQPAQAVV